MDGGLSLHRFRHHFKKVLVLEMRHVHMERRYASFINETGEGAVQVLGSPFIWRREIGEASVYRPYKSVGPGTCTAG